MACTGEAIGDVAWPQAGTCESKCPTSDCSEAASVDHVAFGTSAGGYVGTTTVSENYRLLPLRHRRVDRVTQAVAEPVVAEHGDEDQDARQHRQARRRPEI